MDDARARRLTDVFAEAEALDTEERRRYCDALRAEDRQLAAELESLLAAHDAPGSLDALAARVLPGLLDRLTQSLGERALEHQPNSGRYDVLERLGGGGMGEVYRARDRELDRLVALKFLPWHLAGDADARARLTQEARAASALDHPNVAVVYEIGATAPSGDGPGEGIYIAMAHYGGETLAQKLAAGPLSLPEALDYARQAAAGLAAAHEAGIVHRDIKPANLMVTERGQLKVLDFGIAKVAGTDVTHVGSTAGTVSYMSPEQTRGEAVDARSDVWSLGVVLYEMLTGARPFEGDDGDALMHAIRSDAPPPLCSVRGEAPGALEALVDRCLRKDPAERYADAGELLRELGTVVSGSAPHVRPRNGRRAGIAALAALVLAGALWLASNRGDDTPSVPASAENRAPLRLAVLPFIDLGADSATDFLGYALAEEVAARLGRLEGLILRPSSAVRMYHGQDIDVQQVAGALGVDHLLIGTYVRTGATLRLSVQLVTSATDDPLWSDAIETEYGSEFGLADIVTQRVADHIGLEWRRAFVTAASADVDPTAYHLHLRSFGYPFVTADGNRSAYNLLKRSVELDSSHASAFTALGYRAYQLGYHGFADDPAQALEEAERAFEKALALDSLDMQALSFQALLLLNTGRLEEALQPLHRALTLRPDAADAWISLGHVYRQAGLLEESARCFERAAALDPTNHRLATAGVVYYYLGRHEEAQESWALDPYEPPSLVMQGLLHMELGRQGPARDRFEAVTASGDGGPWFGLIAESLLAHLDGDGGRALARIRELEAYATRYGSDGEGLYHVARLLALFGDTPAAVRILERAVDAGFFAHVRLSSDPFLGPIREDPGFHHILAMARNRHAAFRAMIATSRLPQ